MKVWLPTVRAGSGADVHVERLARALQGAGVAAEITWLPRGFELFPAFHRRVAMPPGCDIIHANSWTAGAYLDRGVPVVATVHHLVHDPAYAPFRSAMQALYHRFHILPRERAAVLGAACVTAVSAYVGRTVTACMGRSDIDVIPNWVDCDAFSPGPAGSGAPREGPFRLLCVGNNSRRKGSDLVEPLADRLGAGFEVRCTGGLRGGTARRRTGRVAWLGRLSDDQLIEEYRRCDVVVSLSRYEGFGYSALEGMACGKPVVAFAAGGLREVVRHGETGFLVELEHLGDMVARIHQLAGSPLLRERMGAQARADAVGSRDSWRAYLDVYRRANEVRR